MKRPLVLLLIALLGHPTMLFAQSSSQNGGAASAERADVDVSKLGVSLSRIRRELAQAEADEVNADDPLRLRFTVEVVGSAPPIDLLDGFAVEGPVPYGPPTHEEVLNVLTPKEFRSPVVPFYSLAVLAAQKLSQYSRKKQCEAELEEYRRMVLQGINVAAPRCTQ